MQNLVQGDARIRKMNEYLLEPGQQFCFKLIRRQHGSNRNNLAAKISMQNEKSHNDKKDWWAH